MRDEDLVCEVPLHFPFYAWLHLLSGGPLCEDLYWWTEGDLRQNWVFYKHTGSFLDIRVEDFISLMGNIVNFLLCV